MKDLRSFTNPNGVQFVITQNYSHRRRENLYQVWAYQAKDLTWDKLIMTSSMSDAFNECRRYSKSLKFTVEWRED